MRRRVVCRLLPLVLLAATVNGVRGDDDQSWVGRDVLARSVRFQPRAGGRVSSRSIVCVRTVKQAKGDWLAVGDGWMRRSEVVPVEEAIAWFTNQIERRPTAFDYVSRAAARSACGDYEGAASDCSEALRVSPRFYTAYYHRAAARSEQGRFEEAVRDYDAALRLNPALAGAYVDRGAAKLELGNYPGSLSDVNRALRLSPRNPDAYYVRGVARYHLHQYGGAVGDLNYALRAKPDRAVAYDVRGACKQELGQLDAARTDFDKAVELDPTIASARRDKLR
ncbi:MAG TPA: tetratricopeptide repeat protein [Pirellulales bacterium]|nr:tetratricopeptide repeat protein [Pirellulales bacterium]